MNRAQRTRHARTWLVLALVLAGALGWALFRRSIRPEVPAVPSARRP